MVFHSFMFLILKNYLKYKDAIFVTLICVLSINLNDEQPCVSINAMYKCNSRIDLRRGCRDNSAETSPRVFVLKRHQGGISGR